MIKSFLWGALLGAIAIAAFQLTIGIRGAFAVLAVAVGLIVSFYAFWDLQFGVYDRHWGWYFGVLAACFLLIAYGAYVLMELPEDWAAQISALVMAA
jgi:hypothetical protein